MVIICGPRKLWLEPKSIQAVVDLSGFKINQLLCGMAYGVDMSAWCWADTNNIPTIEMPYMKQYGSMGGHLRNQKMVDIADAWIGITDDSVLTTGTKDCYNRAFKAKLPMYLHNINGLMVI